MQTFKILVWSLCTWKIFLITLCVLEPQFQKQKPELISNCCSFPFLQLAFPIAKLHGKFTTKE